MADMVATVVTVKMAEMDVVSDSSRLKTILGSCVGIILRDPERRVSGLAHVMLPATSPHRRWVINKRRASSI